MRAFFAEEHRLHAPPVEVFEGGVVMPYFECPQRAELVREAVEAAGVRFSPPQRFGLEPVLAVHDGRYVEFLRTAWARWKEERAGQVPESAEAVSIIPATFPPRGARPGRIPACVAAQAGYFAFDLNCPITSGTWEAAAAAADVALSAASALVGHAAESLPAASFALCRPPGHHAAADQAGGYCYLNNAAIAARWLLERSCSRCSADGGLCNGDCAGGERRVAVLDVDYHAGNGTQSIFARSPEVLTISLHADPDRQYPYFIGFEDERGEGPGEGKHANVPLAPGVADDEYIDLLERHAFSRIREHRARFLVVSFGADTFAEDPLGDLRITTEGFRRMGAAIEALRLPTVVVMEGGYANEALGRNVAAFLSSFSQRYS